MTDQQKPTRDFESLSVGDGTARAYVRVPDGARAGVVVDFLARHLGDA